MLNFVSKDYLFILILCISLLHAEEEEYDDEDQKTLESESLDDFDRNLKEKLLNITQEAVRNIANDNTITNIPSCTNAIPSPNTYKTYSYTVSIQRKGSHYASGALVDKKWILTAAGPFYNMLDSTRLLKARLGSVFNKKGGTLVPIKEIVIHPLYINMDPNNDLALLRIANPVSVSDEYIIKMSATKGQIVNAKFQSTYWSRLIINNRLLPSTAKERVKQNNLRVSTQKLIPREKCVETLEKYNYTCDRNTVCLEPIVLRHTPCLPDVGAPVTLDNSLWGITSGWTSKDCPQDISPTVFNRVSLPITRNWIESTIQNIQK